MEELIREIIQREIPLTIDVAKVISVKSDTCHVESLTTEKDFFKCRLNAIETNDNDRLKLTPKKDSTVVIGIFKGTEKAVVLALSEVQKVEYVNDKTKFILDEKGYNINRAGKNFGDLLNLVLDTMIDQNQKIQELNSKVQLIIVSQGTGPDVPGLTLINQQLAQIALDTDVAIRQDLDTIIIADNE